ncbi:SBP (S-ribonuclease binding protein) family protein [Forsythia ovata]|uniref:SBP (S-ribonuclease binding protein) family protein n=1 Tax=Forsythia ovata TaxID=205694 RepID=A0ABD1WK05_9LAMI
MKQVAETAPPPVNLHNFQGSVQNGQSQEQEMLNMVAPFKSFTAMLTEVDNSMLTTNVQHQSDQIDQIINTHYENLRRLLAGMWGKHYYTLQCAAEERVAKKLKQQEMELMEMAHQNKELEEMLSHFKAEAHTLSGRLKSSEQLATSLRAALCTALSARPYPERPEADAESSFVDPERDFSVKLECKVCERRLATVMLWPCCHVCVCTHCEAATKSCPVCRTLATTSVHVHLPLN